MMVASAANDHVRSLSGLLRAGTPHGKWPDELIATRFDGAIVEIFERTMKAEL